MMDSRLLLLLIFLPALSAVLVCLLPRSFRQLSALVSISFSAAVLLLTFKLYGTELSLSLPWAPYGFEFRLRHYHFSSFLLIASAAFSLLVSLFSLSSLAEKNYSGAFHGMLLLTLSFVNGVLLADNLILLLFFWEALLITLFAMIYIGHPQAYSTAIKALIISGTADLCLMFGVGLTIALAHTATLSAIHLPLAGLGGAAFILLMISATAKAGAMPFHSWIPTAALDAPLPFMALVPAAIEKLVGIYFLTRISLDLFVLEQGSWISTLMMLIGAVTILLAVGMALVQKDFKSLLSFHAISQVGYMIIGIGTCVPAGIVGGIFHMINHALYKCCLFLSAGAVEKQAGSSDLSALGGLWRKMPITFFCFIIAACSISGVPPFNGFFSKELLYDAALERSVWFYAAALLGSVLTAASFLKLGHAAFIDKPRSNVQSVREAPLLMLIPMLVLAATCVLFGLRNDLPLRQLIQPILGERLGAHDFAGWPHQALLVLLTVAALLVAIVNHIFGVIRTGSGLGASEHIHHAPLLSSIYRPAEAGRLDPYELGIRFVHWCSRILWRADRLVDWIYEGLVLGVTKGCVGVLRALHTGSHSMYVAWSIIGLLAVIWTMLHF